MKYIFFFFCFCVGLIIGFFIHRTIAQPTTIPETIIIKGKSNTKIDSIPYPEYVDNEINTAMLSTIDSLISLNVDTVIINKIIEVTRTRYYKDTTFALDNGDTLLMIVTSDTVNGYLTHHRVDWKTFDQTITIDKPVKYITKPLKFSLSATLLIPTSQYTRPTGIIQLRAKRGIIVSYGYNTDHQSIIGVGKVLFEK